MINFNTDITQDQARYIIEEVLPKAGWRIDHTTLSYWMKAHNFAFREQVGIPSCGCEYKQTMMVWQSRIGQYEQQIRDIAYPPVVTETGTTGKSTGKTSTTGKSSRKPKGNSGLTD